MDEFNTSMGMPFSYTFGASSSTSTVTTTNTNSSYNPFMDSRIWSQLPQRLLDRVIACLPPPAFFRFRAVCKRWYGLLFSPTFLELHIQISPPKPHWFLFFRHKSLKNYIYANIYSAPNTGPNNDNRPHEGYLFDPYDVVWYRLYFPLIPSGFSPSSCSGGLICWVSNEANTKTLILTNPLVIGSLTQLPPTSKPRLCPSIGLFVSPTSIDVAVAGDDLISPYAVKNLSTESFHIDASGFYSIWGTTCLLPRLCSLESGKMVHVGGRFYCMNYSPFSVLGYEIGLNNWVKIQAPMRRFLRSPSLVESRGKLVLVAAVEKSKLNVPKSLRLWGLQGCGTNWVEIERMPQQLYLQFAEEENGNGFDCVGHGEFIVIMIKGSDKALLFDICRKRWQWIPPCPFVNGGGHERGPVGGELHGFAYEPKLATPVTGLLDQLTMPFHAFDG